MKIFGKGDSQRHDTPEVLFGVAPKKRLRRGNLPEVRIGGSPDLQEFLILFTRCFVVPDRFCGSRHSEGGPWTVRRPEQSLLKIRQRFRGVIELEQQIAAEFI